MADAIGSWLPACARSQPTSDFCFFCQRQGILHIDAEVPDRALDLRMAKQDLDRAEITGRFVDDRRLRPPEGVRATIFAWQADARHPLIHQAGILAGAHVGGTIGAAREGIIFQGAAPQIQPTEQARASVVHQLELNGPPGF